MSVALALTLALAYGEPSWGASRQPTKGGAAKHRSRPRPPPVEPSLEALPPDARIQPLPADEDVPPAPLPSEPSESPPAASPPPENVPDEVEKIELDVAPPPAAQPPAPAPVEPPPSPQPIEPDSFQLAGWGKLQAVLAAAKRQDVADGWRVPFEPFTGRTQLSLRGRYGKGKRFEAVVSGLLDVEGGSGRDDNEGPRIAFEGLLREAYVGLFWDKLDLRLGQQRVAWGRGDAFTPNDVLNPRDLRDPLLAESELLYLPMPMLRADVDLGMGMFQAIVAPFYSPDRFDLYGGNWAVIQADADRTWRGLAHVANSVVDLQGPNAVDPLWLGKRPRPTDQVIRPSVGGRFSWTAGAVDLSLMYQRGYTGRTELIADPAFLQRLDAVDFTGVTARDLAPLLVGIDPAEPPLRSRYVERHHVGSDFQTTLGPIGLHGDLSYQTQTVQLTERLGTTLQPSLQAALGTDWSGGDRGKLIQVELGYQRLLGEVTAQPLLFTARQALGLATIVRWTFLEHLELELKGSVADRPYGLTLRPQVAWRQGGLELRAGAVLLHGDARSVPRYYRHNNGGYAAVRYSF